MANNLKQRRSSIWYDLRLIFQGRSKSNLASYREFQKDYYYKRRRVSNMGMDRRRYSEDFTKVLKDYKTATRIYHSDNSKNQNSIVGQ